jgi:hypothetical protein
MGRTDLCPRSRCPLWTFECPGYTESVPRCVQRPRDCLDDCWYLLANGTYAHGIECHVPGRPACVKGADECYCPQTGGFCGLERDAQGGYDMMNPICRSTPCEWDNCAPGYLACPGNMSHCVSDLSLCSPGCGAAHMGNFVCPKTGQCVANTSSCFCGRASDVSGSHCRVDGAGSLTIGACVSCRCRTCVNCSSTTRATFHGTGHVLPVRRASAMKAE